ncbi:MAG TPA: hypothetical protein P5059_03655 [Candidatus Dojkabacteria bacterium]|nr:hypothetical protein [Candidatus Dojkabacteria bacterium]
MNIDELGFEANKKVQTGEQGPITETVIKIAEDIPNDENQLVQKVSQYVKSLTSVDTKEPNFSRNADQIIESGEQRGCHEAGLVFITLLRAKGRENTTYIQAFKKSDLRDYDLKNGGNVGGHAFIRTKEGIVDSTSGKITQDIPEDYILGAEGLDSWDIGIKKGLDDYMQLFLKIKHENKF